MHDLRQGLQHESASVRPSLNFVNTLLSHWEEIHQVDSKYWPNNIELCAYRFWFTFACSRSKLRAAVIFIDYFYKVKILVDAIPSIPLKWGHTYFPQISFVQVHYFIVVFFSMGYCFKNTQFSSVFVRNSLISVELAVECIKL